MFTKHHLRLTLAALACSSALIAPLSADAATATGSIAVSATVADSCTVMNSPAAAFGAYSYAVAATATATITVSCTDGTSVSGIALDAGLNPSGDPATQRNLKSTSLSTLIPYALYSNSGYTTAWTGTAGAFTATASSKNISVYAQAPSGTNVPAADDYGDTVGITVSYT
jgi:spore coat protein U-like protein